MWWLDSQRNEPVRVSPLYLHTILNKEFSKSTTLLLLSLHTISVQCECHKSSAMSYSSEKKKFSLWYKMFKTQRPHKLCFRNGSAGLFMTFIKDYWMNFAKQKKHTGHSWKGCCFFSDILVFPNSLQTWNTFLQTPPIVHPLDGKVQTVFFF